MKKTMKRKLKMMLMTIVSLTLLASCNKEFENKLKSNTGTDANTLNSGEKRVLYIIMDGVRGSVVKSLAPVNLSNINANAISSYDGLADNSFNTVTNAGSWTNMITGVDYQKHNVQTEDFANFDATQTPTIFTRLKTQFNSPRTVSFAASTVFNDNLASDATIKQSFVDDVDVKDAAIKELTEQTPKLLLVQFHSADIAGINGGYQTSNASYTSAIQVLDGYLGEILTALRARPQFSGEQWMVVVASNKGGGTSLTAPDADLYQDASRNTFVTFYNPKFQPATVLKPDVSSLPYTGFAPNFTGNSAGFSNAKLNNATTGEFGTSGEFTVMMKIRVDHAQANFAPFFGKLLGWSASTNKGWCFYSSGNNWVFRINGSGTFARGNVPIRDGIWHTIAIRIYGSGTNRKVRPYTDATPGDEGALSTQDFSNTQPLTLGYIPHSENKNINVLIKDIAIYNIAIPEAELIPYMRKTTRRPTDIYFNNLTNWWPCDENQGDVIKDKISAGTDFKISNAPTWKPFTDLSPNLSPEISPAAFTVVPNGVDIPYTIFYWYNIAVPQQWNLKGKLYQPTINFPNN